MPTYTKVTEVVGRLLDGDGATAMTVFCQEQGCVSAEHIYDYDDIVPAEAMSRPWKPAVRGRFRITVEFTPDEPAARPVQQNTVNVQWVKADGTHVSRPSMPPCVCGEYGCEFGQPEVDEEP